MPQLIFLAIVVGAGWLFYNRFIKDAQRLAKRSEERRREEQTGAQGTLIEDPATGEYRVRRDDE